MPLLIYTLARFALLAVVLGALWLATLRGWLWLGAGLAITSALAYLTMRPLRDAATKDLAERRERRLSRQDQSVHDVEASIEDEQIDASAD